MNPNKPIQCGVVGVGYLGQHHARIYNEIDGCELAGIYEVDPGRAAEIADKYGCRVFDSLEAVAANCDAVSVVVPTDKHCEVAVPLLEGGCHLLIEKPLCVSSSEAETLLNAANRSNRIIQVGHIEHYNPVTSYLEKAVDRPLFITADRLAPFTPRGTEVGVVLDLMIHDLGVILQLVGAPVEKVESVGVNVLSPTEDIANTRITFANGAVANVNTSRVSEKKVREIRVFQSNAYLSLDFMNQEGHFVKREGLQLHKEEIPIEKGEPLKIELISFLNCVRNLENPKVDATLGKQALELALRITEQIRQRLHQ
ncbi:MAG: Gfo/Idh/MocA family oxidoreductase [Verrucomicrobiae bacterium]|nr:Gfo/Idh/MocA family oxidoreductase [Verrucomicrobiae bacterium]